MRRSLLFALSLAAALVAAAPAGAFATPEPKDARAARSIARREVATALLNRAQRQATEQVVACRRPKEAPRSTVTHDAPDPGLVSQVAAFRRPQTAAEAAIEPFGLPPGGALYADQTRIVTAADGQAFVIALERLDPGAPAGFPTRACLTAVGARLEVLLRHRPALVAHLARRELAGERRAARTAAKTPTTSADGLFLFTRDAGGGDGGGGGDDAGQFARRGELLSMGGHEGSRLDGIVPDGVASVTLSYPRVVSRGPLYKPVVHPHAFTRTVRVQENVFSLRLSRTAEDAVPARTVWRAADGHVVRAFAR